MQPQQDDHVAECQVESVNRDNNSIIHNSKPQQASDAGGSSGAAEVCRGSVTTAAGVEDASVEAVQAGVKEEKQQQPLLSSAACAATAAAPSNGNANEAVSSSHQHRGRPKTPTQRCADYLKMQKFCLKIFV